MSAVTLPQRFCVPLELRMLKQWVLWRKEPKKDGIGETKVPYVVTGQHRASSTDPRHWSSFESACDGLDSMAGFDGIGFVFTPNDEFCGIDLDELWLTDETETPDWVTGVIEQFMDTYSEESPSKTGLKIWVRAKLPPNSKHEWRLGPGKQGVEIYDHARYFAVTGISNGVRVIAGHQEDIYALVADLNSLTEDPRGRKSRRRKQHSDFPLTGGYEAPHRHRALLRMAGKCWSAGFSVAEVSDCLHQFNVERCVPPKPEYEVERIIWDMHRRWTR